MLNKLKDSDGMEKIELPNTTSLVIDAFHDQHTQFETLNWIGKLNGFKIKLLYIRAKNRIQQNKLKQCL